LTVYLLSLDRSISQGAHTIEHQRVEKKVILIYVKGQRQQRHYVARVGERETDRKLTDSQQRRENINDRLLTKIRTKTLYRRVKK